MTRPIFAVINTNALKHNLQLIKNITSKSKIWSVIKADAYGHGIKNVWKSLIQTDGFAVLTLDEAILLRKYGCNKPILLLEGIFHLKDLDIIYKYNFTITIHSYWQLNMLILNKPKYPIDIYIKINSGMNRLGFNIKNISKIIDIIKIIKIKNITFMAHFANTSYKNYKVINNIINTINNNIINTINNNIIKYNFLRSFANSAAILWHPQTYYDWVRPGIILYGASPTGNWNDIKKNKIIPVMTLNSEIISIQKLLPGNTVGYNDVYHTNKYRRIGIIACGYADGYPRNISNNTPILVDGHVTKILGDISMDMIAVDLINIPNANIGSKVELWGENIKIDDIAQSANTIGYEIMCSLSKRVPIFIK
ncbi:alanine racemase [Enterobacteriaceae endosymbiont of Plateumaris consimilis]|uniref:alanine racemase n=1 Tax=Enterobacteriaceae endosymbiont of Plateumaris consimilis TaxID=2675794 RepID=UPI001448B02B|nr:alanine racemase [Enterobacteriaceae endosymbiont of Plateumaris consimilis]QJC28440.1 alanine racemase [Enterobacteriaceae endosymbiont of Plateumaris consimilis]